MADKILEVKNLKKYFQTPKGTLHAVDDVTFTIERGKTLGIVGESGCGKSTTGRTILRLLEPTSGEVLFEGKDVTKYNKDEMRKMRKEMQLIFQDPFASLNPRKTVSEIIGEPLTLHKLVKSKEELNTRVLELMEVVGLAERLVNAYPHELDGGRRQRIGIARALALEPKFIVCDEPVSALDVSIQAQVLNLLQELKEKLGLTYFFISHNLNVVYQVSDRVGVMYLGRIVEIADYDQLYEKRYHPYTEALLSAIPQVGSDARRERIRLTGEVPSPSNPPSGCRFHTRCPKACDRCSLEDPVLQEVEKGHFVACHLYGEGDSAGSPASQ